MLSLLKKILINAEPVETFSIQGRKPAQEDDFFVSGKKNGRQLLFVADGVGGHGHGDFASGKTVEVFKEAFEELPNEVNVKEFLYSTVLQAAHQVLDKCLEDPSYKNCGTTISGFFVSGNIYHTFNVGDSRVYLFSDGVLSRETHDHSVVQELLDSGQITEDEAFVHPKRNMMTSAIGQNINLMKVDVSEPRELIPGDVLMAFSDGVHDALTDNMIFNIVKEYKNTEGLAKRLVDAAFEAGGKDNITAVVFRYLG
ncbi:MAG: serine/threonine-protein phosphatase [Bacteroidales bacterium]|nr:serine/threonine-protein phosphatase [Bacteroidales bacterium]